jgi:hypothetical protein
VAEDSPEKVKPGGAGPPPVRESSFSPWVRAATVKKKGLRAHLVPG